MIDLSKLIDSVVKDGKMTKVPISYLGNKTGANENYKGKLIDLPGFDKPVKLIYTARGRVFYKLRSLLFSLTEENPYKVLCFPNIFWNKLTAMLQYKKYHQSDIDWLVEQYA